MFFRSNFAWGTLDVGVFVMMHDKTTPSDEDWTICMQDLEQFAQRHEPSAIVFTDGGAPRGSQRSALNALVGKSPPTAVVSDALATRFVVSSFALVNPRIACFSSVELEAAWRHLGLAGARSSRAQGDLVRQARTHAFTFRTARAALGGPMLVR